ncbi:MAG: potassium-transporting ATPase subunit KdpC [Alphaproteobacteria bacterium]
MLRHIRPALVMLTLFTLLTGLAYPLLMVGVGEAFFKHQAEGSPIVLNGKVIGSKLIGQGFSRPEYFWGRPSAAGKNGYDARSSSGSNLGPTAKALADRIAIDAKKFAAPVGSIPQDLLTASASGLDPDISLAAARFQVARVAAARELPVGSVIRLIERAARRPSLGFIGEPHVNVLQLNLALDALSRTPPR